MFQVQNSLFLIYIETKKQKNQNNLLTEIKK